MSFVSNCLSLRVTHTLRPLENSTISSACMFFSPYTRAIPSPIDSTFPVSSSSAPAACVPKILSSRIEDISAAPLKPDSLCLIHQHCSYILSEVQTLKWRRCTPRLEKLFDLNLAVRSTDKVLQTITAMNQEKRNALVQMNTKGAVSILCKYI